MTEIKTFIHELEKEVQRSSDTVYREEQLVRLQDIAREYDGEDKIVSSLFIAEKIREAKPEEVISTGFNSLDNILGGFRAKQLVVVSAATKSGKTSFCVDITARNKQENPLWLPFEESAEELIQKFLDRGDEVPLFYTPERITGNTLLWIEKKIIESKAKYDTKIVFIDHLHFIVEFGANMSSEIGNTMRALKQMAKRWNVVIVIIAHLKKTKMENQPDLEDLRDSSFIAQEADTVLMLWREVRRVNGQVHITDNVNVSVQANRRNGKTGNVRMIFKDGKFLEENWDSEEEKAENDFLSF